MTSCPGPSALGRWAAPILLIAALMHTSLCRAEELVGNLGEPGGLTNASQKASPIVDSTAGQWSLLWADEFEGDAVNETNWNYEIGTGCQYLSEGYPMCGWGNFEHQYYSFNNAHTEGGNLVIEARKEEDGTLTSARLTTFGKYSVKPNLRWKTIKVEGRIQLPFGQGIWPAFWMVPSLNATCLGCGKYGRWAASGEIDIMETKNDATELYGTLHFGSPWPNNKFLETRIPAPLAGAWGTFAVEWESEEIRWYYNDDLYGTQRSCKGVPGSDCWFSTSEGAGPDSPFDQPFHLVLNLALGGGFTGNIPRENVAVTLAEPKQVLVDYVRVFGRK